MTEDTAMKHTVLRLAELLLAPPLEFDWDGRPGVKTLFPQQFFARPALMPRANWDAVAATAQGEDFPRSSTTKPPSQAIIPPLSKKERDRASRYAPSRSR
jgi:hypothetical protein